MTPEIAKSRIRAIQYDMSIARKRGIDTDSEDYSPLRNEIKTLRDLLKKQSMNGAKNTIVAGSRAAEGRRRALAEGG